MIDYDIGDQTKTRKLYYTKNDAQTQGSIPFGEIVDYNETITPVIGIAKPSNFTLLEKEMVSILILMLFLLKVDWQMVIQLTMLHLVYHTLIQHSS